MKQAKENRGNSPVISILVSCTPVDDHIQPYAAQQQYSTLNQQARLPAAGQITCQQQEHHSDACNYKQQREQIQYYVNRLSIHRAWISMVPDPG